MDTVTVRPRAWGLEWCAEPPPDVSAPVHTLPHPAYSPPNLPTLKICEVADCLSA